MKRVLIIHGFDSNSKKHWFQEEKKLLESKGYEAEVPDMPNPSEPKREEWVQKVRDFYPGVEDILIGHSLGVPTILRYLEKTDKKVGKVFLVAAFAEDLNRYVKDKNTFDDINNFIIEKPFNWEKIKASTKEIYVINQKNDEWVPKECGIRIAEYLETKIILVDGTDHFDKMDLGLINNQL